MLHEYRDGRTCNMVCMNIRIKNSVEILVWYLNTVTYHQQFCLKYMIDYEFIMCKTYHGSHWDLGVRDKCARVIRVEKTLFFNWFATFKVEKTWIL